MTIKNKNFGRVNTKIISENGDNATIDVIVFFHTSRERKFGQVFRGPSNVLHVRYIYQHENSRTKEFHTLAECVEDLLVSNSWR